MSKIDAATIEKFKQALQKDPNSQIFATLAEAYRELKMLPEAEKTVRDGMKRHPNFVGGLVTLGRILQDLGKYQEALAPLKKAAQLAPENILAHQLMGEMFLQLEQPKDALKSFKMVLFLNPNSKTAKNAVSKLESLSADEYDDEVFEMTKLHKMKIVDTSDNKPLTLDARAINNPDASRNRALERMLSLIDAFIVRNDLEKAHLLLKDTHVEFGDHPEIQRRMKSLQVKTTLTPEEAVPLKPLQPTQSGSLKNLRHDDNRDRKIRTLKNILENIEEYRHAVQI